VLKDWSVRSFAGDKLEIIKGNRTFTGSYFDDRENMAQLESLCRKFFERPISLRILDAAETAVSSVTGTGLKNPPETLPDAVGFQAGDPTGEVLRIFEGRVSADTRTKNPAITPGGFDFEPPDKEDD